MLRYMRIRHLGVIDDVEIEPSPGLTVISGETGAGKTMLVSGIGLLVGQRADSSVVRHGCRHAVVEGVFDLSSQPGVEQHVAELGGEVEDGEVIVSRTVSAQGRSRAHVGGQHSPASALGTVAGQLIAMHGQADQWRLKRPEEHKAVVDHFGGASIAKALARYQTARTRWKALCREREELIEQERTRLQESVVLRAGLEDIMAVDPQPGEETALRAESEKLTHAEDILLSVREGQRVLSGDDEGSAEETSACAVECLAEAVQSLSSVTAIDPQLGELHQRLQELSVQVVDVAAELSAYASSVELDPHRLEWVHARRAELTRLTRTYAESVDGVLAWARDAEARLARCDSAETRIDELGPLIEEQWGTLVAATHHLTACRTKAARRLSTQLTRELGHLAMGKARVHVRISHTFDEHGIPAPDGEPPAGEDADEPMTHWSFGPDGADVVEILMAANPGAPLRTVSKAASGGELSRLMLAIEVVTGGGVPTYIFDEVDAGVGGAAALDVGQRLAVLARSAQVIVVTHVPQVAAYADSHLVIQKSSSGQITTSGVRRLAEAERRQELARMMAGSESQVALEHAEELLKETALRRGEQPACQSVAA